VFAETADDSSGPDDANDGAALPEHVLKFQAGLRAADPEFLAPLAASYRNTAAMIQRAWSLLPTDTERSRELFGRVIKSLETLHDDVTEALHERTDGDEERRRTVR